LTGSVPCLGKLPVRKFDPGGTENATVFCHVLFAVHAHLRRHARVHLLQAAKRHRPGVEMDRPVHPRLPCDDRGGQGTVAFRLRRRPHAPESPFLFGVHVDGLHLHDLRLLRNDRSPESPPLGNRRNALLPLRRTSALSCGEGMDRSGGRCSHMCLRMVRGTQHTDCLPGHIHPPSSTGSRAPSHRPAVRRPSRVDHPGRAPGSHA